MFLEIRSAFDRWFSLLAGWPRRLVALGCLLMAGVSALGGNAAGRPPAATVPIAVAAHDLRPGAVLASGDVRVLSWPRGLAPPGALRGFSELVGQPVGAPMSAGEPFTNARLLDGAITDALRSGEVAVTVHLATAGPPGLIQAGSRIDLFAPAAAPVLVDGAAVSKPSSATAVASSVRVLAVLRDAEKSGSDGANVVLAVSREVAPHVANQPSGAFLATLLPPSTAR